MHQIKNKKPFVKSNHSNFKKNKKPNKRGFVKKIDERTDINIKTQIETPKTELKDNLFTFTSALSTSEFANKINKNPSEIIKHLFLKGIPVTLNTILTEEQIGELCLEFGYDFEKKDEDLNDENLLAYFNFDQDPNKMLPRPPIVTIMGHVDHGKTSLLDKIRTTNVISTEHGGITQHIGSYQVEYNNKKISFLDTPGHEAFTKMRARGASITDIVVLVIAADDGVKQQTIEALNHARAANVKIIVFINKMDLDGANPHLIKSQLYDQKLEVEDLGGDIIVVEGSVKKNQGINELLESILFVAEMMNLKANPNQLAYGTIIEAHLNKGFGPIATLLVQNGTIIKGDYLALNSTTGKVRIMHNDKNQIINSASPSTPVVIAGLIDTPQAGDKFFTLKDEKTAKMIYQKISEKKWKERIFNLLNNQSSSTDVDYNKVNVIIKTDVHGSLEAIKNSLEKLDVEKIDLRIINSNTGSVNESDLQLAKISKATIFCFNVKPSKIISEMANQSKILIRFHNVIYTLIDEVKQLMLGSLDPVEIETIFGEAVVQQLWKHSEIGTICGCRVVSGKILRNSSVRIIRDGIVIYTSKIGSLRHGKKDEREILVNNDCGITINNFNDLKVNDVIECFEIKLETQHEGLKSEYSKNKKAKKKMLLK